MGMGGQSYNIFFSSGIYHRGVLSSGSAGTVIIGGEVMATKLTTQSIGNALGIGGLIVFPILLGFAIWRSAQVQKQIKIMVRKPYAKG